MPRPFHFAWVFLSSVVYVISRSVVVRRRTGRGIAPMWVSIAGLVLSFIFTIYITAAMMSAIFATIPTYGS
jgi:FtsH-binding integral membrane protein